MQRRKHIALTSAVLGALATVACGGSDRSLGPHAVSTYNSGDTTVSEFQVDPTVPQLVTIDGVHDLLIPANTICALATSSYGPTEWDQPCAPETEPVTVTARVSADSAGNPRVDFSPALRFDPAGSAVKLYLKAPTPNLSGVVIVYCPESGACVNEGATDAQLKTYRDRNDKSLFYRRIKHFSGYMVVSGYSNGDGAAAL